MIKRKNIYNYRQSRYNLSPPQEGGKGIPLPVIIVGLVALGFVVLYLVTQSGGPLGVADPRNSLEYKAGFKAGYRKMENAFDLIKEGSKYASSSDKRDLIDSMEKQWEKEMRNVSPEEYELLLKRNPYGAGYVDGVKKAFKEGVKEARLAVE